MTINYYNKYIKYINKYLLLNQQGNGDGDGDGKVVKKRKRFAGLVPSDEEIKLKERLKRINITNKLNVEIDCDSLYRPKSADVYTIISHGIVKL